MQAIRPVFLRASWQNLVMINYKVDPVLLLPYLPPYTELDTFNQTTLVSVVGFMFTGTTVFGLHWPYHTHFEEVNLRFYVKRFDGRQWKRGVVFISEIVPRPIIATIARTLYHEPYRAMKMRREVHFGNEQTKVGYHWKYRDNWNRMEVTAGTARHEIAAGSEEEFIFEHYWGYNRYDEATTIEYAVEHPRWQVQQVTDWILQCDVAALYGQAFVPYLSVKPTSVLLAVGSGVLIRKPVFIKRG